ncbi:MAG: hypothetical protein ABIF10_02845 [Candidatus Woesearchaeota archaeon]
MIKKVYSWYSGTTLDRTVAESGLPWESVKLKGDKPAVQLYLDGDGKFCHAVMASFVDELHDTYLFLNAPDGFTLNKAELYLKRTFTKLQFNPLLTQAYLYHLSKQ